MTSPEQHAATVELAVIVREFVQNGGYEIRRMSDGHNSAVPMDEAPLLAALDELVSLAGENDAARCAPRVREELERADAAEARADELQREREAREQFEDDVQAEAQETGQLALALDRLKLIGLANMVSPLERERNWYREEFERLDPTQAEQARREADQLRAALREIAELCEHWEKHDKTDPDEHERGRLAAIRRAQMVGDKARAALAGVQADKPASPPPADPNLVRVLRDGVQADNKDSA